MLTSDSLQLNSTDIYLPLPSILLVYIIIQHQYFSWYHLSYKLVSSWMNKYLSCSIMDIRANHSLGNVLHDITNTFAMYRSHCHDLFLTKMITSPFLWVHMTCVVIMIGMNVILNFVCHFSCNVMSKQTTGHNRFQMTSEIQW